MLGIILLQVTFRQLCRWDYKQLTISESSGGKNTVPLAKELQFIIQYQMSSPENVYQVYT